MGGTEVRKHLGNQPYNILFQTEEAHMAVQILLDTLNTTIKKTEMFSYSRAEFQYVVDLIVW